MKGGLELADEGTLAFRFFYFFYHLLEHAHRVLVECEWDEFLGCQCKEGKG